MNSLTQSCWLLCKQGRLASLFLSLFFWPEIPSGPEKLFPWSSHKKLQFSWRSIHQKGRKRSFTERFLTSPYCQYCSRGLTSKYGLMPGMKLNCHLTKQHIFIACAGYLSPVRVNGGCRHRKIQRKGFLSFLPYIKQREECLRQQVSERQTAFPGPTITLHFFFFLKALSHSLFSCRPCFDLWQPSAKQLGSTRQPAHAGL